MKKRIIIGIVFVALLLGTVQPAKPSCEQLLIGLGAGAAGKSALDATEASLLQTGEELQDKRTIVVQEVQDANTPEELSLAERKLAVLDASILANKASVHTVQTIKAAAGEKTPQGRTDAIATGIVGLGLLALKQWQLMIANRKKKAMKIGQAKLKVENPDAEAKLFAFTGDARAVLGL